MSLSFTPLQHKQKDIYFGHFLSNLHVFFSLFNPMGLYCRFSQYPTWFYFSYKLGFTSQEKANLVSSHINSYPKEKLNGKSSFQLLEFLNPDMAKQLYSNGLSQIAPDEVTLKPYLLKNTK